MPGSGSKKHFKIKGTRNYYFKTTGYCSRTKLTSSLLRNLALSSSTNSVHVGLHFRERGEAINENGKNTKIENHLQNGQEKYGGKKLTYVHIWDKNSNYYNFFKF